MKKAIKRTICLLLTVAMLFTDTGVTVYAAEGAVQAEDSQSEEPSKENEQAEEDLEKENLEKEDLGKEDLEEGETGESSPEDEPAEGETADDNSGKGDAETSVSEENPITEDETIEENPNVEDGENAGDEPAEESVPENDVEEDAEKNFDTTADASGDNIASGEYKENGNDITWTIDKDGKLTVEGTGDFTDKDFYNRAPWYENRESVKSAEVNVTGMKNASYMFYDCTSLTNLDLGGFDTGSITYMENMFAFCSSLTTLDVSKFDTSDVWRMDCMFSGCSSLASLDVSKFDTSDVWRMDCMFSGCSSLTSLDVSGFDTSNVTDMGYMFSGCRKLTSLDLSGFDVSKNRWSDDIFDKCLNLTTINTPLNLTQSITLPGEQTDIWYQVDGTEITKLPRNLNYSIVIRKNEIPTITSAITAVKTKTNYACGAVLNLDDLEVTYYDADGIGTKVTEGYSTNVDEIDMSILGTKILKVTYNGLTAEVRLSVKEPISGNSGNITWTIDEEGKLTVEGTGDFESDGYYSAPWSGNSESVKTAEVNVTGMTNASRMFSYCRNLMSLDLSKFDTSSVTNTERMFSGCSSLTSLDLSKFDTSSVTNMADMFSGCENLTSLNLSGFDTGSVTDMSYMFSDCSSLTSLDLSKFNTSKVSKMYYMFSGCSSLASLDVSGFDTSNVTEMYSMFSGCINLTSLDLSGFDFGKNRDSDYIFNKCKNLTTINTPLNLTRAITLPGEQTDVWYQVDGTKITKLPRNLNYSIVIKKNEIPVITSAITAVKTKTDYACGAVLNLDDLVVTYYDADGMGTEITDYSTNADEIDMSTSGTKILKVTYNGLSAEVRLSVKEAVSGQSGDITWTIDGDGKLTVEGTGDFKGDNYSWIAERAPWSENRESIKTAEVNVTGMGDASYMFYGCTRLTSIDLKGFNTSSVTNMGGMFSGCSSLTSLDVSKFDTGSVTDMHEMFNNCSSLTSLDVSKFDTGSVTNMDGMFNNCSSLKSLDVGKFDTSKVSYMGNMFSGCSNLTSLDVGGFNTSNVRSMWEMFSGCSSLTSLDVSKFDTGNVSSEMTRMFSGCSSLKSLDVSKFNTSNVSEMAGMFSGCSSLKSLDVSKFDTGNVWSMSRMFSGCSSLTSLDVSKFDTGNVWSMSRMFSGCSSLTSLDVRNFNTSDVWRMDSMFSHCDNLTELDLSSFNTSNVENMDAMFFYCYNLRSLDVSSFDTSSVYTMKDMFRGCGSLESLDVSRFNTSNVNDMQYMFFYCKGLTSLDVSNFNTRSGSVNLHKMFRACENLTSLDLSGFDMDNVENMEDMISGCFSLTAIRTPYNLDSQILLPASEDLANAWHDEDGNEYVELPRNISRSILLTRNKADVPIALSSENVIITLSDTYNYVYDGEAKTPEVTVAYSASGNTVSGNTISGNTVSGNTPDGNSITLEQGTDYTVTYENNINAFDADTGLETAQAAPKVIITGQNKYSGTVSKAFSIRKAAAPEAVDRVVYIKDYSMPHEGCTLKLSGCFAAYNDKAGYTAGNPVEDDTIAGNVLSGEVSIDNKGILTYATNAGKSGDFAVIPIMVSFSNHNDAVINVKIVFGKENGDIKIENVSVPTASPESGRQLAAGSEVTLACETKDAEIYYTISGNRKELADPDENSIKYTAPIIINSEAYIRAVAVKGAGRSKFINLHYTVADIEDKVMKPYAVPGQGTVEERTKVELKCDTPDAVIYYTIGGNSDMLGAVPVDDGHKYTEPIEINKDMAIKAVAIKDGMKDSDASVFVYRINIALDAPLAEPASGSVDQGSYISLKTDTGVNIYYTLDQTDPVTSASAKLYDSRIHVGGKSGDVVVIKAVAEKKGVYSETVTFTYMVSENRAKGLQVMLAGSDEYIYTGRAITPAVIVTNNGEELIEGEDYTVRYSKNIKAADKNDGSKAPKITVTGKGNLAKSSSITFTIKPKDIGDEDEVVGGSIAVISGKTAAPVLFYDGVKLTAKDFNNPNAKKKYSSDETITITGNGNFTGKREIDVRVVDRNNMKKLAVVIDNKALKREPLVYDGEEKTLDGYFDVYDASNKSVPLEEYSDYAVIYPKNNINAGKVKFTVVGLGEYYGSVTKSYTIKPRVIKTANDGDMEVNVKDGDKYPFTGGSVTIPDLEVTCDGDVLKPGKDYKVTYSNNKKVCSNNKAKCKINFIGNYKGSKALFRKFNITAAVMDDVDKSVSVAVADMVYTGKPGAYKSIPYVTVNGILLKSSDYKVSYYKDVDREQVIDGKTASSSVNLSNSDKQTVYMKIEGKGNYTGTLTAEYNVYKPAAGAIDLSKAKVTIVGGNKAVYTGEGVTPDIEVKYKSDGGWKTIEADDIGTYIKVTYINNVNKGKATVMVNGNGDRYVGSKTAKFSVVSKSMK